MERQYSYYVTYNHGSLMGLYDRDYGREERTLWDRVENPRSITITLIVINVVVYFANLIFYTKEPGPVGQVIKTYPINDWLAVYDSTLMRPWMWWQFLTYGFAHSMQGIFHLVFNMFVLYVFGQNVERRMGRMEYLRFYLLALIVGGIVGSATFVVTGSAGSTIGASGAVIGVVVLFACYFPNQEVLLMFVFPMKAWVLAVFTVMLDLVGAMGFLQGTGASNTAFTVHLAGAFFAVGYYFLHWNLRWLDLARIGDLPQRMRQRSRRMKLKLHDPDKKLEREAEEADRILAKIHSHGESSLSSAERKTLERYSRRQREKRDL